LDTWPYTVDPETEQLNYGTLMEQAIKEQPKLIIAGYSAYSRSIDFAKFREIADACGAYLMVDMAHISGLVAGQVHVSPFLHADIVTTTTHKTLRGPRGGMIFSRVDDRDLSIKINKAVFPGMQGGPHMNQIAALCVALFEADTDEFKIYTQQIIDNAQALAKTLQEKGWRIVSGGTDNHLMLLDVWSRGITGKQASEALEAEGIIVNMNTIPFDERSPFNPSGIRIGTSCVTSYGQKTDNMIALGERIDSILSNYADK